MTEKLPMDPKTLLTEADDLCLGRLTQDLSVISGVTQTHAVPGGAAPQLCVHYDARVVTASDIDSQARRAAEQINARYGHLIWSAANIDTDPTYRSELSDRLAAVQGVVGVLIDTAGVHVEFERDHVTADELMATITGAPQHVVAISADDRNAEEQHDHSHHWGAIFGERSELIFAALSGVLLLVGFLLATFAQTPRSVEMAFYAAAFVFGAFFTVQETIENIRQRRFEIDFLMLVAAAGAAALGEVAEGALLLFLFSIGHALEGYAMGRARRAIEALAELAPKTALVRRDGTGEVSEVPVENLSVGDVVVVRPNMRLAADGFVIAGSSSVDQAPVTGESVPVDKVPVADVSEAAASPELVDAASRVYAGTINGAGALEIQVSRLTADSTLSRVVKLVSEAQVDTSPAQRFTDKFQRIFVPAVLLLVALLLFAGLVIDEPFSATLYRALAVLVAASPCALAIATPSAVLSAVARAARSGVLVKGGAALEVLGRIDVIAFDKTGTLTEGRPQIVDTVASDNADITELLTTAVAVEQQSDHPLARAIVRDGTAKLGGDSGVLPRAENVRAIIGRGVTAQIDGVDISIGKRALFTDAGEVLPPGLDADVSRLEQAGRTTMLVRAGRRWLGAIGVMDIARPEASYVIRRLTQLGVPQTIMLSGDNQQVADAVAAEIGVQQARGDLMPEDKVSEVAALRQRYGRVAMVGDGVNDAPALANADVGIAMGAAGSDVALETADIALMADDLRALPFAVNISRRSNRVIAQNLWASLGIVAILIPATIFGLGIGPAVLIHEGSTLIVVANALRLLALRDRD
ncbi:heavy metal translocating P-type ATPase [Mycobacteroides chelonae]|uniref:heavy metal translocating P-type ATPase n=1 Tax=Mycobacteroides chelonae TaxID=1774 RepID=UPI0020B68B54|nr:heavy metal translocating P-type ATPase [Mycobacteroides chelonae]MEC4903371.1 heavy metal translocating P-type ATPase [Mycobacteroides chelonae]